MTAREALAALVALQVPLDHRRNGWRDRNAAAWAAARAVLAQPDDAAPTEGAPREVTPAEDAMLRGAVLRAGSYCAASGGAAPATQPTPHEGEKS